MWRAAGATFVRPTHTEALGALVTSPEADISEDRTLRFFIYDLPPNEIQFRLDTVRTDSGELRTFVYARNGSPYIDVTFYKAREIEGGIIAGHGSLAMYPYYYELNTNEETKPSDRLVELFRSAGLLIRARSFIERWPTVPKTFFVEKEYQGGTGPWFDYKVSHTPPTI